MFADLGNRPYEAIAFFSCSIYEFQAIPVLGKNFHEHDSTNIPVRMVWH